MIGCATEKREFIAEVRREEGIGDWVDDSG